MKRLLKVLGTPFGFLLALFLLALGAFFRPNEAVARTANPIHRFALEADRNAQDFAPPQPACFIVSTSVVSGHPELSGAVGTPTDLCSDAFTPARAGSESARRGFLIEALILSKYLHFQESLSSP